MNKHEIAENETARPLARVLARELSQEEVALIGGGDHGGCDTCGGNGGDGTTEGPDATDLDRLK